MITRLLALALLLLVIGAPAQPVAVAQTTDVCADATGVPADECAALLSIYMSTNGTGWASAAGWMQPTPQAPCDWQGVSCAGGRVVGLSLPRNGLKGPMPGALGALPSLASLDLSGNQLQGVVPPAVCSLTDSVTSADLSYNALTARHSDARACLEQLDPGWATTQTSPPRRLRPTLFEAGRVRLGWEPVTYGTAESFYEISYATSPDGPFAVHGRTADRQAADYWLDGLAAGTTYFVRARAVTPAHSGNPSELRSDAATSVFVSQAASSILLIAYFPADNDLAPYIPMIRQRLTLGSALNPNAQVVLLTDGTGADDTQVTLIADGEQTATDAVFARWGRRELNTADPAVLAWFLSYARTSYPSEREIVALMGHGLALAPEIEWPSELRSRSAGPATASIPPLPKGIEATPSDVTDMGYMSAVGLGRALAEATAGGADPFDLIFFDQCFQGSLDTLYEVRAAADYFIASPNYAWLSAPYRQYLAVMAPAASLPEIADAIINRYQRSLNQDHPNVIFWASRQDIEAVAAAVSDLGVALSRATRAGVTSPIVGATRGSKYVDTTQCGRQNLTLGPPDELIGAGSFAINLQSGFPAGDEFGVHAAAVAVIDALEPLRKSVRIGTPYLAPDELWDYNNTLTILAPLPRSSPDSVAWRSSVYREDVPFSATWTPVPTTTVQVTASLAFVRDGEWDEFLAAWYEGPRQPSVGEWCHYTPPAVVEADEPDDLSLAAAPEGETSARLSWGGSTLDEAAETWVYVWGPYDVGWVARRELGPDATEAVIDGLLPGERYRFQVVVQDDEGAALARSNEAAVTAGGERLYLPLLVQ